MRSFHPRALALAGCLVVLGWAPWVGAGSTGTPSGEALAAPGGRPDRADPEPATGLEHWLYNPRERASTGLEALEEGRAEDAVRAFDTAADLARESAPEEPWALFDAGSARLVTEGDAERAIGLLERAAETAPPRLAPDALYNLGNARLAAGDASGALDAYRQALRLAPDLQPAKRNLEIAWKRLQDESARNQPPDQQQGGQQDDQRDDRQDEGEQQPRAGDEQEPDEAPETETDTEQGSGDQQAQETPGDDQGQTEGSAQDGDDAGDSTFDQERGAGHGAPAPLPRFQEQPDMTAAQAAALLAAIDHLERSQRHLEAARQARLNGERTKEKDW